MRGTHRDRLQSWRAALHSNEWPSVHIYASVTRVFSCVFALSVGEAIKLC